MTSLFFRNTLLCSQLRQFHKSAVVFSVPTINISKDRKAFEAVFPEFLNSIITGPKLNQMPDIGKWVKQLLNYTMSGGKLCRGLTVSIAYKMFEKPENFTEDAQHSAHLLGWCLEMLQAYLLVLDDIIDGATTRRGKPCWYQQPKIGLSAINDSVLIYQCVMEVLETKFGKTPFYTDLIRLVNETAYRTSMGKHLDCSSSYNKQKDNIDVFTMDRCNTIALYKTSYYSYRFPIFVALLLVKNGNKKATEELNYICLDLGRFHQFQDDYLDAYIEETITGKAARDIQEGKCSWIAVTALERCNEAQRAIFKEYYGSKDPEHVKKIKQLYNELQLDRVYEQCELTMYEDLVRRISALPTEGETQFFLKLLNVLYKRCY